MKDETNGTAESPADASNAPKLPAAADRGTFQAELDMLRVREKAHTREGDAIAAARRRLPMVEVDANLALTGPGGPLTLLDAFEGRRQLVAYYFMWHTGHPAAEQCEGCTWVTTQVAELSYLHSRHITFAVLCQGPYEESVRYRDFMGWDMPWYSAEEPSVDELLVGRDVGMMHIVCYLRDGDRVFETYWTTRRGAEVMDYSYALDGPHRVRTPGDMGRLASRLAATVLDRPLSRRTARLATSLRVARRTPHRSVVSSPRRTLGRPRDVASPPRSPRRHSLLSDQTVGLQPGLGHRGRLLLVGGDVKIELGDGVGREGIVHAGQGRPHGRRVHRFADDRG